MNSRTRKDVRARSGVGAAMFTFDGYGIVSSNVLYLLPSVSVSACAVIGVIVDRGVTQTSANRNPTRPRTQFHCVLPSRRITGQRIELNHYSLPLWSMPWTTQPERLEMRVCVCVCVCVYLFVCFIPCWSSSFFLGLSFHIQNKDRERMQYWTAELSAPDGFYRDTLLP